MRLVRVFHFLEIVFRQIFGGYFDLSPHSRLTFMSVEKLPSFTAPAFKLWEAIPPNIRKKLLANVWCGRCRHEVTITNFSGAVRGGDLLLVGKCSECQDDVARVVES